MVTSKEEYSYAIYIFICGTKLGEGDQFKYLGALITSHGKD